MKQAAKVGEIYTHRKHGFKIQVVGINGNTVESKFTETYEQIRPENGNVLNSLKSFFGTYKKA